MSKHFMLLRKVGRERDLFQTPDRPPSLRDAIESAQTGPEEKTAQQIPYHELPLQGVSQPEFLQRQVPRPKTEPPNSVPQIRLRDAIKEKIRGVTHGSIRSAGNRSDLETLRYREQLK